MTQFVRRILQMLPLFAFLFEEVHPLVCSSNRNCTCYYDSEILFANCSNLHLQQAPVFNDDVFGIILANNRIKKFPTQLPQNTIHLDLSNNSLRNIEQAILANLKNLRNLSLSRNFLQSIELGSFVNSRSLVHLDISHNQELTLEVLVNISRDFRYSTSIRVLNFESLQCTYGVSFIIRKYHIADLKSTQLEKLNLASNRINSLELGVLSTLPKSIKHLNLANNDLSFGYYLAEFGNLQNIVSLNISFQSSFHQIWTENFLIRCNDTRRTPVCRSERSTDQDDGQKQIKWNNFSLKRRMNISIYLPPRIEKLYLHDNLYKITVQDYSFTSLGPPSLTHVYLQNNIIYQLNGPITGLTSIYYMDMSNNFCGFISSCFFDDFKNMSYLDLSQNALGEVLENDVDGQVFKNLLKLSTLNLAKNRIVRLPTAIFRNLNQLEILNLSYNSLSNFSVPLGKMKRLKRLDLSNNQLTFLDEQTRTAIDSLSRKKTVQINMEGNRLMCDCERFEFLKWMSQSKNIKFKHFDDYSCDYINSRFNFSNIDHLLQVMEKQCASYIITIVTMTSSIIIVLTITLSRIVHRYRWKLRYMYYIAREKYRDNVKKPSGTDGGSFHFDAFVSYSESDNQFTFDLVKRLEEDHNLKLCIHNRDFIPGTGIADNITNAIHNSRRTVAIMTSDFLDSYWCMFELNMARMEAIYSRNGENVLILLILEKAAVTKLPLSIMDFIESRTYLEYPKNAGDGELFAFRSKLSATLKSHECDFNTISSYAAV